MQSSLRTPFYALLILFAALLTPTTSFAQRTVTGVGDPGQDVKNVQEAVDAGGTVTLSGRFDFGRDGRVSIRKNVAILGEVDELGHPATTIEGGFWTLYAPLPVKGAPPAKNGSIIAVRNIVFRGAKGTPLHFPHTGGLTVENCVVEQVQPQEIDVQWTEGDTLLFQAGLVVGNRLDHPSNRIKRAARGTVRVIENRFEMENDEPDMTAGYGVMVNWTEGSDILIRDNLVDRASRNGVEVFDNALGAKGRGEIRIEDNRIITADEGIAYPHKYGPNGIAAGWYFSTVGGTQFSRNNRMVISGNRIECHGDASTGLLLHANDIVAACNDIVMAGGSESRGIVQTGSRGYFVNNRVRGEARFAIWSHPFEALTATANTFAWTDLDEFTGIRGQILTAGNLNLVLGDIRVLIDKGDGNRQVELRPCALSETDVETSPWTSNQP